MPRKNPSLRPYFVSFLLGDAATQIQAIAVGWVVYTINHRALDLGLVGLVLFLPSLLLVLVTGSVADRFDRKTIVVVASLAKCAGAVVLAYLAASHTLRLELALTVVFLIGVARAFGTPAERTVLINIVDDDEFTSIRALYSSVREFLVIGGPALGGILVGFSPVAAFLTTAMMFALSIAAFAFVHMPPVPRPTASPTWRSALEGFTFIFGQPVLLGAIGLDLFAVLVGGAVAVLPIISAEVLHAGAFGYGILRSSVAVGATGMGFYLHRRPPTRRIGTMLLASVAGFGVATIVFAYSRSIVLSACALAVGGACDMVSVVIRNGLVQLRTPDAMRGRVGAIEGVFVGASNELGAFESGALAQAIGAVGAVAAGGIATLAIVAIWYMKFPALRRTDRL